MAAPQRLARRDGRGSDAANERIPDLLATPAAVQFVSCEPMLGPVDLRNVSPADKYEIDVLSGYDFDQGLVVRASMGDLRRREAARTPAPCTPIGREACAINARRQGAVSFQRWGKRHAGRLLDGVAHLEFPTIGVVPTGRTRDDD